MQTPSQLADRAAAAGAEIIEWPSIRRNPHPVHDPRARRELRAAVRRFRPDVLALNSSKAGVLGRGILQPPDGITVFTCHHLSVGPGRRLSHRIAGRPVEQLTMRFVDGIISDGARDMPTLSRFARRTPVRLVPNAVQVAGPPQSPASPTAAALWVARLAHPKDPGIAIRAWKHVLSERPDARLTLCGKGPLEARVASLIHREGVGAAVAAPGFVPSLDDEYARASLFLLTSHVEGGITMATLEAMSNGLVPVITDVGDSFLLPEHGAGVVTAMQPRAVADAVLSLLDDPTRLGKLRDGALRFARERWTADDMVDATLGVYGEVRARAGLPT